MRGQGTPIGQAFAPPPDRDFSERFATAKNGGDDAPRLHDPCVITHLLQPALFHARHITVKTGTKGGHTPGMTIAEGCRMTICAP
jgi:inosine-uridine nucleoside N-ribohydrolase